MKDLKSSLPSNFTRTITLLLFALSSYHLIGQIDIKAYEKRFGEGMVSLKTKIQIEFIFNETTKQYFAKVSHKYEKLHLGAESSKGLIQVPFNDFQELNLEKARFYKLDSVGNKKLIENVKVKYADTKDYYINNIFYSDLKVKQFNCSVDLPDEYVVSYTYNTKYTDLKFLTSFYFQNVNEAVEDIEISIRKNPNVQFSLFEFNLNGITKTEDENYIRFKGSNLKRFKPTITSVNGNYFLPHFILSVGEVKTKKSTTQILKTTDDLYVWYKSLIDELKPDTSTLNKLAESILENEIDDSKKIEKIFKWVQSNIQYVAFENGIAGFKPEEAHEVVLLKYGDCKGMANLLVNLLKTQGFDARHTWIGTRANNYTYDIPSLAVDNHMICSLNFNNKLYYLDATSKSAKWNNTPAHLEGKQALVSNNDSYAIQTISKSAPKDNTITITGKIDLTKKTPEIDLQFKLTGHFYRDFLSSLTYASARNKESVPYYFLSDYLNGISVKHVSSAETSNGSVTFSLSGAYSNVAIGNQKLIFPFLDLITYPRISEQNPPNYIDYPQVIDSSIEIYNPGSLPKENYGSKMIGNEHYNASYFTETVNGKFIVKQKITFNALNTSPTENDSWNSFFDQINSFNNLPITYD